MFNCTLYVPTLWVHRRKFILTCRLLVTKPTHIVQRIQVWSKETWIVQKSSTVIYEVKYSKTVMVVWVKAYIRYTILVSRFFRDDKTFSMNSWISQCSETYCWLLQNDLESSQDLLNNCQIPIQFLIEILKFISLFLVFM